MSEKGRKARLPVCLLGVEPLEPRMLLSGSAHDVIIQPTAQRAAVASDGVTHLELYLRTFSEAPNSYSGSYGHITSDETVDFDGNQIADLHTSTSFFGPYTRGVEVSTAPGTHTLTVTYSVGVTYTPGAGQVGYQPEFTSGEGIYAYGVDRNQNLQGDGPGQFLPVAATGSGTNPSYTTETSAGYSYHDINFGVSAGDESFSVNKSFNITVIVEGEPDLTGSFSSNPPLNLSPGQSATAAFELTNTGSLAATGSVPTTIRLESVSSGLPVFITTPINTTLNNLAPGATTKATGFSFLIP